MPDQFFDPSIALGVKVPPPPAAANPFELLTSVGQAQKTLVDAQSAKAVLDAHRLAGQHIAAAPSLAEGLAAIEADPVTAGYAQDIAASLASTQQTLTAAAGLEQGQNSDAFTLLMKSLGSNVTNPAGAADTIDSVMATLPPGIRSRMGPAVAAVKKGLTDDLPPGEAGVKEFQKRLAAGAISVGGLDPSALYAQTGNLPPSLSFQPFGKEGATVPIAVGGPVVGPQEPPHQVGVGPEGAPLTSLSPKELQTQISKASNAGPLQTEMAANAEAVPRASKQIYTAMDALTQFQAGGGADSRTAVGTFMQGLKNMGVAGITDAMIKGVANGSLDQSQLFNSEIKPLLVNQLKQAVSGTGQARKSEIDAILESMDIEKDPQVLLTMLNQALYQLQIGYSESVHYLDYKQRKAAGDPSVQAVDEADYPIWYQMQDFAKNLPTETGGGIPIGPRSPEGIKGIPQGASKKAALDDIFGPAPSAGK